MALEQVFLTNLFTIAMAVSILWAVSLLRRDAGIVDIFWGAGFVLVAWLSYSFGGRLSPRTLVLVLLVSVWGLRLSSYLAWRNWGKPEDYRYAAMREHHGKHFPRVSLLTVFWLQGALMWIISLPIQVGIVHVQEWNLVATVGVILCVVGIFFETIGDYQLARFKAISDNNGRVMNRGLWRYTRHPNYFGDFLVWWGFYLLAAEPGSWWWTIIGPLLMSVLLIRVSGVRLLEDSLRRRVTGYTEYVRDTSAFFPMPPKRSSR
jgi:steroid 5-alpha reductase family enzyme